MSMEAEHARAQFLEAVARHGLKVLSDDGRTIELEKEYSVEVESNGLLKLRSEGLVVAPFSDAEELCRFIKEATWL